MFNQCQYQYPLYQYQYPNYPQYQYPQYSQYQYQQYQYPNYPQYPMSGCSGSNNNNIVPSGPIIIKNDNSKKCDDNNNNNSNTGLTEILQTYLIKYLVDSDKCSKESKETKECNDCMSKIITMYHKNILTDEEVNEVVRCYGLYGPIYKQFFCAFFKKFEKFNIIISDLYKEMCLTFEPEGEFDTTCFDIVVTEAGCISCDEFLLYLYVKNGDDRIFNGDNIRDKLKIKIKIAGSKEIITLDKTYIEAMMDSNKSTEIKSIVINDPKNDFTVSKLKERLPLYELVRSKLEDKIKYENKNIIIEKIDNVDDLFNDYNKFIDEIKVLLDCSCVSQPKYAIVSNGKIESTTTSKPIDKTYYKIQRVIQDNKVSYQLFDGKKLIKDIKYNIINKATNTGNTGISVLDEYEQYDPFDNDSINNIIKKYNDDNKYNYKISFSNDTFTIEDKTSTKQAFGKKVHKRSNKKTIKKKLIKRRSAKKKSAKKRSMRKNKKSNKKSKKQSKKTKK